MRKFEDIRIGDSAELEHEMTELDIQRFVTLSGDNNRLHTDAEFARQTTLGKPVAHGMIGASFISTIIGTKLPGDGALWFSQSLEFLQPVRVGDRLVVSAKVVRKHDRDRVLELETQIVNQHRQVCTTGLAKVRVNELLTQAESKPVAEARRAALVLGATGGIGRAACIALARKNFDVVIHTHSQRAAAEAIAEEVRALGREALVVQGDICDESKFAAMAAEIARREFLLASVVHCAITPMFHTTAQELTWEQMSQQLDVNLRSAYFVVKHLVPQMAARKYGKLVFLTTQYVEAPVAKLSPYITSKAALVGFSKAMAIDLAASGIRVNLVSPGMTRTPLISAIPLKAQMLTEAAAPLRRLATPEDVANAITFLSSAESDYLTGETIRVNGGQVML